MPFVVQTQEPAGTKEGSLSGAHDEFHRVWNPQNCMQNLECIFTFLGKGTLAFLRVLKKFNFLALHKEKEHLGFILSSATNCYVSLKMSFYISAFIFLNLYMRKMD